MAFQKGFGKGPLPMMSVTRMGIEVRTRGLLKSTEDLESMLEKLGAQIEKLREAPEGEGKEVAIADLDISQNRALTEDDFDRLFTFLGEQMVRVLRLRAFGNPTWDDAVCKRFAEYLETLTPDSAPQEIHLSDCSIQCEGFQAIVAACENLYPCPFGEKESTLYLRLESNYIKEETIQEQVDAGVVVAFQRGNTRSTGENGSKIDLVHFADRGFKQQGGDPPAPEDRPGPKPVNDPWRQQQQQQQQQLYQQQQAGFNQRPPFQQPMARPAFVRPHMPQAQGQARPQAPQFRPRPQQPHWPPAGRAPVPVPALAAAANYQVTPISPTDSKEVQFLKAKLQHVLQQQQQPRPASVRASPAQTAGKQTGGDWSSTQASSKPWVKVGGAAAESGGWKSAQSATPAAKGKGKGASPPAKGAGKQWNQQNDRSRSPKGKVQPKAKAKAGKGTGKGKAKTLPPGWESHFSDEHKCVYYWNEDRQESSWDFPTA